MRSHLLEGKVRHRRIRPSVYELEHDVFYFALDLAEIDEVARRLRLVAATRANVLSFHDADHLVPPAADLRRRPRRTSAPRASTRDGWRITLVDQPARPWLRVQPGQLLPLPQPGRRTRGRDRRGPQHARRAPPLHAPAPGTPAADVGRRWTRRSMSRHSSGCRADTPSGSRTGRTACASCIDEGEDGAAAAPGERSSCGAAAERSRALRDARPKPVRDPEDDRADPLARAAAVAAAASGSTVTVPAPRR